MVKQICIVTSRSATPCRATSSWWAATCSAAARRPPLRLRRLRSLAPSLSPTPLCRCKAACLHTPASIGLFKPWQPVQCLAEFYAPQEVSTDEGGGVAGRAPRFWPQGWVHRSEGAMAVGLVSAVSSATVAVGASLLFCGPAAPWQCLTPRKARGVVMHACFSTGFKCRQALLAQRTSSWLEWTLMAPNFDWPAGAVRGHRHGRRRCVGAVWQGRRRRRRQGEAEQRQGGLTCWRIATCDQGCETKESAHVRSSGSPAILCSTAAALLRTILMLNVSGTTPVL